MRRCCHLIFTLLVIGAILVGCAPATEKTVSCQGLTITLPSDCMDLSGEEYAKELDFLYACSIGSFLGVRELRSELEETYPALTLENYARLQIKATGQDCQLERKDGIYTYTYTAQSGTESITYISAVFETKDAFWAVQAYCVRADFPENQAKLWKYLASVQV